MRKPLKALAAVLASTLLLAFYAQGGLGAWLGFVCLVPWLLLLDAQRSLAASLGWAWLMSLGYVGACLYWFAPAIASYTGLALSTASLLLLLAGPLLQPQILIHALVRHVLSRGHGRWLLALAASAAWVGSEWLLPKLFGDTLGHGLAPSMLLRQAADLGGAAGLSFVLLLANEAVAAALTRGRARAQLWAGAGALAGFALLLGYGALRLHQLQPQLSEPAPALRVGLVQSGIVDYERRRAEVGAYAVVREVLDTHFAMSMDAVQGQGAQALLWSETVYPTPFGHPRSADGAELDRELLDFVEHAGVPLLFGTYDVDAAGEYNAAALLEPEQGLIGYYRKTRPFPLTEYVPAWLDHARLRRWLPWAGTWRPGDGVRVLPLRSAGGPEINFVPLICLDAVDPRLAIEGARLGAQAILSLSNDAWFSAAPQGAHLHLAVASFRSIETRLPQLRVTSNGMSAVIDETGEVLVATSMGSRAVLVGSIPARARAPTLMVRLGDWVGAAALVLLGSILLAVLWPRLRGRMGPTVSAASRPLEFELSLLSPGWRLAAAALRVCAGAGLLAVLLQMLLGEGLQVNSLRQIKLFAAAVLAPALAAWALQRAFALRARVEAGALHLAGRGRHTRVELGALTELRLWRLPLPRPGLTLVDADGRRIGLAFKDPRALLDVLAHVPGVALSESSPVARWVRARALAWRPWLDHALLKFVLFPLLPALPAFRLHQYIAFGGSLGELYTYGLGAWFGALLLWWVSWAIGMCLLAAAQRALVELTCLLGLWLRPQSQQDLRQVLEWISRAIYYLGVPAWLALRLLSG